MMKKIDKIEDSIYIDRELSWLKFNERVLMQADSDEVPLLERMRFCAIFTSNNDEFFMTRVANLIDDVLLFRSDSENYCNTKPLERLRAIYEQVRRQYPLRDRIIKKIIRNLCKENVVIAKWSQLDKNEKKSVNYFFKKEIKPLIRLYCIDDIHMFPHICNTDINMILTLTKHEVGNDSHDKTIFGIIPFTDDIPKYWSQVNTEECGCPAKMKIVLTEEIIKHYIHQLLRKYTVKSKLIFKVTRNTDLPLEDEIDQEYPERLKRILKKRDKLNPVRLEYVCSERGNNREALDFLRRNLNLQREQLISSKTPISYDFVQSFIKDASRIIPFETYSNILPVKLNNGTDIFNNISNSDILLNYPYHSMSAYLEFLHEAVYDKNVCEIKITLYRLSRYSEVISLLKYASERGKKVTAAVELKARFDEENNIHWAEELHESGCHVIYGINYLKIHSKVTLITRHEQNCYRQYAHIASGNYNEQTAKLYTDVGILTSNYQLCNDAAKLFKSLEDGCLTDDYSSLLVSPTCLKQRLINEINRERDAAKHGKQGYICMKMNSLTDKEIMDSLIRASSDGVKIELIVRGICCLKAGVPGTTENISVISIVGRYLEHSRIYIFGKKDGIPSCTRVYIGSADMMTRNTSRRVEVLTPVYDRRIAEKLIKLTELQLSDNVKACDMLPDGSYKKREPQGNPCDSQMEIYKLYN